MFGVPLFYDDGSLMHAGMYFDADSVVCLGAERSQRMTTYRIEHYGKGAPPLTERFLRPRPVPGVTGAFMSCDRNWFEKLGGFTEQYVFGGYEDADLCLKSLERGVAPWLHDLRFWHLEGKASIRSPVHDGASILNRWLFGRLWGAKLEENLLGDAPAHPLLNGSSAQSECQPSGRQRTGGGG
jgi:GT2 family glycosyltransferase